MRFILKLVILFVALVTVQVGFGQIPISESEYQYLKERGQIGLTDTYLITAAGQRQSHSYSSVDASFTQAMLPSDDGSSSEIVLPFNFCFYGQNVNSVYINTNGNISFGSPFSSGTPFNMPFVGHKIIAPFWADVDTRARGGVFYKLTSNALIVNWEDVGYFNQNDHAGNSFQLIISNGTSALLPFGYTVGFFYDEMQWSTGDASGGLNGFGGAPAQIGINKGDGVMANKSGRFNKNTGQYYTHPDSTNGVLWLETNNIYLNPCNNTNNRPSMMGSKLRDTIGVCVGDTIYPTFYFPAGDVDQQTFVNVPSGFNGFSVTNLDPGYVTQVDMTIIGQVNNMGTHVVTFNVADNGVPAAYEIIEVVFQIDSLPEEPVITGISSICADDSTQLQVQSVYSSYKWSTGDTTPSIIAYPGMAEVEVEYNKCVQSAQVNVVGFTPSVDVSGKRYLCLPDTTTLIATAGMDSYDWSTGDSTSSISVGQLGTYSVTVSQQGCFNVDSLVIDTLSSQVLTISASRAVTCNGDSVVLNGNPWVDSLIWSTGDTTRNIKVPNGNYTSYGVLVNAQGNICIDSASVSIGASTFDSIVLVGDTFYCGNSYAELTTTEFYEAYWWSNNNTGAYSSFVQPGPYSLVVLQNQCRDTTHFSIVAKPTPNPVVLGAEYICGGANTELSLFINFFDSVLWSNGSTSDTVNVSHGAHIVKAWQGGCEGETEFRVTDMKYGVRVKGASAICPSDSGRLFVDQSFDTYLWNTGDTTFDTYAHQSGSYYCVVNLDTCTATTDTANIILNSPEAVEILGDTVMCDSLPGFLFVRTFNGYAWSNGSFAAGITYSQPGPYSVTVTDINGCLASDTVDIKVVPGIVAEIVGDSHYCHEDSVILTAAPTGSYHWSTGDSTQKLVAAAGIHAVTVTAPNGCRSFAKHTVISTSPVIVLQGDSVVCEGGSALVSVPLSSIESVQWSNGSTSDTTLVSDGLNSVTITDVYGCATSDTFQLAAITSPIAGINMQPNNVANAGDPVQISDASNPNGLTISQMDFNINDTLFWASPDTVVVFLDEQIAAISQVVIASNGCSDTVTIDYQIVKLLQAVNIVTPNNDGVNDYLAFPNLDVYSANKLEVFNRWGTSVYSSDHYQNNWDAYGMADGTYFYVLESAEGVVIKGYVSIMR